MQLIKSDAMDHGAPAYSDAVCGLIGAVGRGGFIGQLLESSQAVAPIDFVSMFLYPSKERVVFLGTASGLGQRFANTAADHYQSHYYREDPNIGVMFDDGGCDGTVFTYLTRDDIPTASYRTWCYDRAQIADRLSLVSRTEQGMPFSVSFYSGRPRGTLPEVNRQALMGFLPYVRAISLRHLELWSGTLDLVTARARVTQRFPELSPRETDVAAGVVAGLTAQEMADWLGIAPTSVITHRKRAYERLGVANQREMVQAFYSS
ncbi:helix-turn-helix transcriptional regulator [Nitratireductor soli]|uniref:helix-turn-helix transcriptional regulator n=1 Tax=Nitratireductor soli TaxID=1670619 RepID=UPI00065E82CF|nr:helix-turn-helix transcriptional regulator [Nitratireductor soli]